MTAGADRHRRRMAELMLAAEAERAAFRQMTDEYRRVTGPFDQVYLRATHIIRARPWTTTLLLGLGGVAVTVVGRRLPLRGVIRGIGLATVALRSLRSISR
jgi:hypothetical protein